MAKKQHKSKQKTPGANPLGPVEDLRRTQTAIVAALFGVGSQTVRSWHLRSLCPRNDDKQTFDLAEVIRWHENWRIDSLQRQGAIDEGSPGIERLRLAKAEREEIRLEMDKGRFMSREDVHQALGRLATILRETGQSLGRQFGREAQGMLDEALSDFEQEVRQSFEK